jgi:hypothetical protein
MFDLANEEHGELGMGGSDAAKALLNRWIIAIVMRCHSRPARRFFT